MISPEQYLLDKGFKLRAAPGEHQTQCPFCGDKNKYGHLYVNRDHGAFICHKCGEKGSFYALQVMLGDKPEPFTRDLAHKWDVWADMVDICTDALLDAPEARDYLRKKRGLSSATIAKYRLGWADKNLMGRLLERWSIADLKHAGLVTEKNGKNYPIFWDRVVIPYYQREHIVTIRGKSIDGGGILQAKDTNVYLFGVDNLRGHKEVVLCEGELDAIFLDQQGYATCAIPGALNYQEAWNTWFEGAKRVFVVLDADDAGEKGAVKVEQFLGKRARIVDLPVPDESQSTDITEYFLRDLHTKDEFQTLLDQMRGHRLYGFLDGLKERDELLSMQGLQLGWKDLDWSLRPGLLPGQVMVVLAKTGEGKSAMLTQIAHNLSAWSNFKGDKHGPGVPTMLLSLEQTKAEMTGRLERVGRIYNPWASTKEMGDWYHNFMICDENRIPPTDIPALYEEFIDRIGEPPRVMLVDYLGYWARAFRGKDRYHQVSDAIMELKRFAKDLGVVIITPHQVSREGKVGQRFDMDVARDAGTVEETADFVFSLFRPEAGKEDDDEMDSLKRAEVRLEILKSRHGNKGRVVSMLWTPYSLAMVPRGEMDEKVRVEWKMYDSQALYEEVLKLHSGGFAGPSW